MRRMERRSLFRMGKNGEAIAFKHGENGKAIAFSMDNYQLSINRRFE
jgi:hypothetical protein